MRSRRPLVLVVHDDSDVRVAQANDLGRAGYRCLVASDPAAGLWFALKFALEMVPTLYSGVVLVSPDPPAEHELPATVTCVPPAVRGNDLIEAVGRASWTQQARLIRTSVMSNSPPGTAEMAGADSDSKAGTATCS